MMIIIIIIFIDIPTRELGVIPGQVILYWKILLFFGVIFYTFRHRFHPMCPVTYIFILLNILLVP